MLELPEIDDRDFSQLLAEAKARIPVHNPEWVNFNDADPGMTLLQLWAFMSENLLYQAKLIPERNRLKFLKLLGIEPEPARAAEGIVAFSNLKGRLDSVTLAADLEVLAGRIPFRTQNGLTVLPVEAQPYVKRRAEIAAADLADVEAQYELLFGSFTTGSETFDYYEATEVEWSAIGGAPLDLATTVDGALWLALLARSPAEVEATRDLLGGQVLTLGVVPGIDADRKVLPPGGPETTEVERSLEYHVPNADEPLPATAADRVAKYRPVESTASRNLLLEPGVVQLQLPAAAQLGLWDDLDPGEDGVGRFPPALEGEAAERIITWIRVRPAGGDTAGEGTGGQATVSLSWVGVNAAAVRQRAHVPREVLGLGTGQPDQTFTLANTPVLTDTLRVTVDGAPWARVDDLMLGGPEVPVGGSTAIGANGGSTANGSSTAAGAQAASLVYKVARESGTVTFGDGIHGARPPAGAAVEAAYDYGGGRSGLVGPATITKAASLPAGVKVTNPLPTWGGDEPQSVAQAERTISQFVRHRDRMVTPGDFAEIVRATPGIDLGRVEVLPLFHPDLPGVASPGVVTLLLIPKYDAAQPDHPEPDRLFLQAVCDYADERRLVTTELHLRGPTYTQVWLSIGIDVLAGRDIGPVREAVKAEVRRFLSPLLGGHLGTGWPLVTPVNRLEVLAVAARVDGVAKVFDVLLTDKDGAALDQVPMATSLHLPRLMAIDVRQGDPLPLADLRGDSTEADDPGAVSLLPIPFTPEEC